MNLTQPDAAPHTQDSPEAAPNPQDVPEAAPNPQDVEDAAPNPQDVTWHQTTSYRYREFSTYHPEISKLEGAPLYLFLT